MKGAVCLLIVGLLLFGCFAGMGKAEQVEPVVQKAMPTIAPYATHTPIRINSDSDPQWGAYPGRVITGFDINGTVYGFCIFIGNCSVPFTVKDCYLHNAIYRTDPFFGDMGLYLYNSSNGTVINNNCSTNVADGILLDHSNNNTLMNNNCSMNNDCGINLYFSNNNTLMSNNCTAHYWNGFQLYNSNTNILTNNNCTANSWWGIYLDNPSNNTITNNMIKNNNKYGIKIDYSNSTKNRIYHNYFINNNVGGKQAYDNSGKNFWNSSYPSGGNYWSDWTSPDVKSGSNQDISGSDGIVDSPYILDGGAGAQDFYPLTTPLPIPESPPPALALVLLILLPIVVVVRRKH
jgi:parallel beta-helix repeat protein